MIDAEVWMIPADKEILVTDFPGSPASIWGYVSEEAKQAAEKRGYATISEIGFPKECYLGHFTGEKAWETALTVVRKKAEELGYRVIQNDSQSAEWSVFDEEEYCDEDWWPEDYWE